MMMKVYLIIEIENHSTVAILYIIQSIDIDLNIGLKRKKIDFLPVTAVQSDDVPILADASTSAQASDIEERKYPEKKT